MKKIAVLFMCLLMCCELYSQSWESIRDSEDYICGEGWGNTVSEADQEALSALIGSIRSSVTAVSHTSIRTANHNGKLDEQSQFNHSVKSYSQSILTNTKRVILQTEPNAHVCRWMKKSELDKIFELRKNKAIDMVENAFMAEQKGKADDALRNYYWALSLLKTLQYPNEVTYKDNNGRSHVLTNWIKEKMDDVFDDLRASVMNREGDLLTLMITYKGKPVNTVEYTYYDGWQWGSPCGAKDGYAVMELVPEYDGQYVQLQYEYKFMGEAKSDKEMESVLELFNDTPMPKASVSVALNKPLAPAMQIPLDMNTNSFSLTEKSIIAPPKEKDVNADSYAGMLSKFAEAVKNKNFSSIRDMFTDSGWDVFTKLIRYGKAKVLDSSDIRFFDNEEGVMERGLKMSFSFAKNVRKSFVEDVVLQFDKNQKICNITFGLGKTAEDDILNKGVWDENSRLTIMNFLENYKTAYALKRLQYIESVFDDDAVVITGTVVKKPSLSANVENQMHISSEGSSIIKYNRQTKDQYLRNLKRCFERNEFVNIRFSSNDVKKLGIEGGESYAIQIQQDYYSSTYGDKGYLMLIVDVNDPHKPLIKVRTWQPEKDPEFGIYGPEHF